MNMNDMVAAMMDKDYTEDQIKSAVDEAIAKERIKRESEKTKAAKASEETTNKLRHDAAIATAKYLHAALPNHFEDGEDSIKLCEESLKETEDEFREKLEKFDKMLKDSKAALESLKDFNTSNDEDDDDILDYFLKHLS